MATGEPLVQRKVVHKERLLDLVHRFGPTGFARIWAAAHLIGTAMHQCAARIVDLVRSRRRVDHHWPWISTQTNGVHQVDVQNGTVLHDHSILGDAAVVEGWLGRQCAVLCDEMQRDE